MRAIAAFIIAIISVSPALAQYKLAVGDVVDFNVAGTASLHRLITVDMDGRGEFPLIGSIDIAGKTINELQDIVRKEIPKKSLTLRSSEANEKTVVIDSAEVALSISEYRPVYVTGDVAKPGEIRFRPGLTVRQAVALAGGYDILRYRMENPFIGAADYRADYVNLWYKYASLSAERLRIEAQLGQNKGVIGDKIDSFPIPSESAKSIIEIQKSKLNLENEIYQKERALYANLYQSAQDRLNFLQERQKTEQQSAEIDATETSRLADLNQRGVVPITRLVDQRRLSLISSNSALEVGARTEQTRTEAQQALFNLDNLDRKRRLDLMSTLNSVNENLNSTRERIQAVSEKMLYTNMIRSKIVRGPGGSNPLITVSRRDKDSSIEVSVDDASALQPGDVINVVLNVEMEGKSN